ncbi:hypothetical protein [Rhizobium sp. WL3]|uniref:hypothetical protein n=1 Tax=Rhizobium sp. WL3 TaxID=2603277 RepID=UPI001650951F|nr:hypothetical protein [Rhizobium sp. WL3]
MSPEPVPSMGREVRKARRFPSSIWQRRIVMLKFLGGTIGVIFLIGLAVVVLLLMLIF